MSSSIAQVKKLRGKSLRELRARGRQELTKFGERVLRSGTTEMSDNAFLAQVTPTARAASAEATALLILESIRIIFPHLARRAEIIAIVEKRFASERAALIKRAERAINGDFDLLGFKNISFGSTIDWRLEPQSGKRTSLEHWSAIDYLN